MKVEINPEDRQETGGCQCKVALAAAQDGICQPGRDKSFFSAFWRNEFSLVRSAAAGGAHRLRPVRLYPESCPRDHGGQPHVSPALSSGHTFDWNKVESKHCLAFILLFVGVGQGSMGQGVKGQGSRSKGLQPCPDSHDQGSWPCASPPWWTWVWNGAAGECH